MVLNTCYKVKNGTNNRNECVNGTYTSALPSAGMNNTILYIPGALNNHTSTEQKVNLPSITPPPSNNTTTVNIMHVVLPIIGLVIITVAISMCYFKRKRKADKNLVASSNDKSICTSVVDMNDSKNQLISPKLTQCHYSYFSLNFPIPPQTDILNNHQAVREDNTSVYYDSLEYQDLRIETARQYSAYILKCDSACAETPTSPNSTIKSNHVSSILMTAERQHLQHELPTILHHVHQPLTTKQKKLPL